MKDELFPHQPSYAVHPGEYVEELLETYEMSISELSTRLGTSVESVQGLISGKGNITPALAEAIGHVFPDRPAKYWLSLQKAYDEFTVSQ